MHNPTTTRRTRLAAGLAASALVAGVMSATSSVSAAPTQVEANESKRFEPPQVVTGVGQRVDWFGTPGGAEEHSVRQDQGLFDSGTPVTNLSFNRNFSAGTFRYHCEKHVDDGMVGVVKVPPSIAKKPRGLPFTVRWATNRSNTGNRFLVQYKINNGRWKIWQRNTRAKVLVFGNRNRPVRVVRGKKYSFRVKSGSGTVKSGFSPVRFIRAR